MWDPTDWKAGNYQANEICHEKKYFKNAEEERAAAKEFIKANPFPSEQYFNDILPVEIWAETKYDYAKTLYENLFNREIVRKIGERINQEGGITAMTGVFYAICNWSPLNHTKNQQIRYFRRYLDRQWSGIGDWK